MPNPIQPDQATVQAVVAWLRADAAQREDWRNTYHRRNTGKALRLAADAIERGEPFR
jgi:hypothetical protein